MSPPVRVWGAGLAGCAAAIGARQLGSPVELYEQSSQIRHKVCGEFLSAESRPLLERLEVWKAVQQVEPARITEVQLVLGNRTVRRPLPAAAIGISRFALDCLLQEQAVKAGALLFRKRGAEGAGPLVRATGRAVQTQQPKADRLFGFKAHFRGQANQAVQLYFFRGGYVGVNSVEDGKVNVCGLATHGLLQAHGFDPLALCSQVPEFAARVRGFHQQFDWLHTGPLLFQNRFGDEPRPGEYPAGDALSFIDPFTGSGMLSALLSGSLAGAAAATGMPELDYLRQARAQLGSPSRWASFCRQSLSHPWAGIAVGMIPAALLYRLTRPAEKNR